VEAGFFATHNQSGSVLLPNRMKGRFTAPQISELNGNDTVSYIRPKRKRTTTTVASSATSHQIILKAAKALCNNPLDRLAELLLDWNILSDEQQNINQLAKIPDVFQSYKQYVSIWEPLFIHETKASVFSSLNLEENAGKSRVILLNYEEKHSSILKIQVSFGIDSSIRSPPLTPLSLP
jgi:hypothetical protein